MMRELQAMSFRFKLVLADSLYGESFIDVLYELKLDFAVAIRSITGLVTTGTNSSVQSLA